MAGTREELAMETTAQAQERAFTAEETARLLLDSITDYAIFMIDRDGYIRSWSRGAEKINGYSADEILGKHFSVFYTPEDLEDGKPARELRIATEVGWYEEEGYRVRKDGSLYFAGVLITAIRNSAGEVGGFAKITRDLTERRRQDEERLRLAQAEEAVRLRDEFLSIASHELKTPLTALQLQLHGLVERMKSTADEATLKRLQRVIRSGERLGDLIETLFDVSRISSGKMELQLGAFDLMEAVKDVVDRLREAAAREGCVVTVSGDAGLVGRWDRLRIEQVITNLLSNAIRYASGTPIHILLERERGVAVCTIEDRGPGIPQEDRERVFERFERGFSMRNYGGMGVGLYVTRQIVERHGGTIDAANVPEGGARMTIRLPIEPPGQGQAESPSR